MEADQRNVDAALDRSTDLANVQIIRGDACTDVWELAVPADVVLLCGVFGNITDDDIESTVEALPGLCAPGATVLWTRHRRAPDKTPAICRWFEQAGFGELAVIRPPDTMFCVGAHRFDGSPRSFEPGRRLFTFVGYDEILGSDT